MVGGCGNACPRRSVPPAVDPQVKAETIHKYSAAMQCNAMQMQMHAGTLQRCMRLWGAAVSCRYQYLLDLSMNKGLVENRAV
jgi:hypothetical protein